jgi:hypothetical protein
MKVFYQRVLWNNLFEVCQDYVGNFFIFKNNYYWKSVSSIEEAKIIINSIGFSMPSIVRTLSVKDACAS